MTSYPDVNTDPSSPRYGQHYYIENVTGGSWRVYEDGTKEFVSNSGPDVVSTGGVPGVPAAPAAAPAPASSPPVVVSSSPQPSSGSGSPPPPSTPDVVSTGGVPGVPTAIENNQPGNPREGEDYVVEQGDGGVWHVYLNGQKIFVPNQPSSSGGLDQESTGGVPGVPTAPGFSNSSSSASSSTDSTDHSSGGGLDQESTGGVPGVAPAPGFSNTTMPGTAPPQAGNPDDPGNSNVVETTSSGVVPVSSSDSNGNGTGGTAAPAGDSGATYTVLHGDTLSGIAESHGVSLSQLESLNPQVKDPNLIFPGQTINLGGGGTESPSTATTPMSQGASYTVTHGDTLSGIAESNGISLSKLESLNPQIKDPDLIFPGQKINLGDGGGVDTSTSSQPTVISQTAQPVSGSGSTSSDPAGGSVSNSNTDVTGGTSATDTIDFPSKSSYPFSANGESDVEKAGEEIKAQGWGDTAGTEASDVVKGVFEADSHVNTDPLKINDNKLGGEH